MKEIRFSFDSSGVPDEELHDLERRLEPALARLKDVVDRGGYGEPEASINLPDDHELVQRCRHLAARYADVEAVFVVGIGGSNLGTLAVHAAVNGTLHNALGRPRIFFAESVDAAGIQALAGLYRAYLQAERRVLVVIASKSGTTTETVANAAVLLGIGKADVVAITDEGSALWEFAQRADWERLAIPKNVGGRFSVLSAVGLFPLAVVGVDIQSLHDGARHARDTLRAQAARSAAIRYWHAQHGRRIHASFLFAQDLEGCGKWWRQLVAESLGKSHTRNGDEIHAGVTPTVNVGSTDLHSIGQLALAGPNDTFTTFVDVRDQPVVRIPDGYDALVPHLAGKGLHDVMDAILQGTLHAYREAARPFSVLTLPDTKAYSVGQLLQLQMVETMLLAQLWDVDAFDQPAVESYKKKTRELLQ